MGRILSVTQKCIFYGYQVIFTDYCKYSPRLAEVNTVSRR